MKSSDLEFEIEMTQAKLDSLIFRKEKEKKALERYGPEDTYINGDVIVAVTRLIPGDTEYETVAALKTPRGWLIGGVLKPSSPYISFYVLVTQYLMLAKKVYYYNGRERVTQGDEE